MVSVFVSAPYTNDLGQTINPGDKVAFVTLNWKRVHQNAGIYRGYHLQESGSKLVSVSDVPDKVWRNGHYEDTLRTATLLNNVVFKIE